MVAGAAAELLGAPGLPVHTRSGVVHLGEAEAGFAMSVLTGFAVQLRGLLEILFHTDAVARGMQAAKTEAPSRYVGVARPLEELSGPGEVLPNALPGGEECPEAGTPGDIPPVARLLKECGRTSGILRDARAALVLQAEASAAIHRGAIATLLKERERARGIAFDAPAAQVGGSETSAPIADATGACLVEELGRSLVVLEDVLPLLELDGELVARGCISRITGAAELFGLGVPRMTSSEREGRNGNEDEKSVRAWMHVRGDWGPSDYWGGKLLTGGCRPGTVTGGSVRKFRPLPFRRLNP